MKYYLPTRCKFLDLSTFPLIFIILSDSPKSTISPNIYIYIYIHIILRKNKTGHIRIINLFPSCYVFLIKSKTRKKCTGLLQI